MKFCFQKLGLLDKAELELADLTIICGENNSGKTYATYAIYGFLRCWRNLMRAELARKVLMELDGGLQYQFDLSELFSGKVNDYLGRVGNSYKNIMHSAFATSAEFFKDTVVVISVLEEKDFLEVDYQQSIQLGSTGKVLATLSKKRGSGLLEVFVSEGARSRRGNVIGLKDFIADAIVDVVFSHYFPAAHISSAERTGAAIFRQELDVARTRMIKALNEIDSKELRKNPLKLLQMIEADYAWPVEDNIDFVRRLESESKELGELAKSEPGILRAFDEIVGGTYKVVKDRGILFQAKSGAKKKFSMNEASSCIRALLDVGFYIKHKAKPGDLFIIDEPELNLHPKNQRAFARLAVRLVNAGIKLFITTHSDYIVKELNTLIMLKQEGERFIKLRQKHGYEKSELLSIDSVRLYVTGMVKERDTSSGRARKINSVRLARMYQDRGIEVESFDNTIELMNEIQSEIVFGGEL